MGEVNIDVPPGRARIPWGVLPPRAKKIPNFIYADWHRLPFRDHVFTSVFSRMTYWWEDDPDPEAVLGEIMRVLKFASHFFVGPPDKLREITASLGGLIR